MPLCAGLVLAWAVLTATAEPGHPWLTLVFHGLVGAVAIVCLYRGLAELLNTTVITIGPLYVSMRQGPIPWPGMGAVPLAEVLGARVGCQMDESEVPFTVYLVAGSKERPAFPGFSERQDADRIASAVNASIIDMQKLYALARANASTG